MFTMEIMKATEILMTVKVACMILRLLIKMT